MNSKPSLLFAGFGLARWLAVAVGLFAFLTASATSVVPPSFAELVADSDYVIRGTVWSVRSEYQPTPGGGRKIKTFVEIQVKEVIAGNPPARVVLELLGGRIGDEEMRIEGAPRFQPGEEDILFVSGNGRTMYPLKAMMHGRYPVLRDEKSGREYVTRSNLVPLYDTREVAMPIVEGNAAELQRRVRGPGAALTPAQFIQQIRNVAQSPNVRAKQQR